MMFDWSDYLDLAKELAGQTVNQATEEAKLRSSVSSAYYAAFCKARNYLRDIEGRSIPSTGDAHVFVRDEFRYSADRLCRKIGNNLNRLRMDRNKVDYDDSVTGLSSMVIMDLTIALKVISTLNTL
jgi:uncharacterized protein (UPF0332 family)